MDMTFRYKFQIQLAIQSSCVFPTLAAMDLFSLRIDMAMFRVLRGIFATKNPCPHDFLPTIFTTFSPRCSLQAQCACPGCLRDNTVKRLEKKLKPNSFKYGQNSHKAKKAVDKPTGFFGLQEFQGLNPLKF